MPSGRDIYEANAASIARIEVRRNGTRLSSGSAFIVSGKIITCAHVVTLPSGCHLRVEFEKSRPGQTCSWDYRNLEGAIIGYAEEHSHDYAILNPPADAVLPPGLRWADDLPIAGEPVCLLGYPFEDPHLTLHQGYVSAVFRSGVATMLKLDMSVNPSNSGGPLIRLADGGVVGVVARKATGLTRAFDDLLRSYDDNIAVLEASLHSGAIQLMGINPLQVLLVGQEQMKRVSLEIVRSANVGIGYAIWIDPLRRESSLLSSSSA